MSLMARTGPLGTEPHGEFNFAPPPPGRALLLEPTPKRIRVEVGGETIADSRRAFLLHEGGHMPLYYFPPDDVRADVLEPSDRRTHCPKKGDASYHTIRVGGEVVENGAWYYSEPLPGAPAIGGLISFDFARMGRWLEEDEEIRHHPRDPYHRVDVIATTRRIRIALGGTLLAETERALALFETSLPPRWYLPAHDVHVALSPSDTTTFCPYKGEAHYRSLTGVSAEDGADLVWFYPEPFDEVARIRDHVCFYDERVDLELDGEAETRPRTVSRGRRPGEAPRPIRGL